MRGSIECIGVTVCNEKKSGKSFFVRNRLDGDYVEKMPIKNRSGPCKKDGQEIPVL